MTPDPLHIYHLALRDMHAAAGATFGVVDGWSLPLHYGDPRIEYRALRERAVVADRSHRSRIIVSGTDAAEVLDATFSGHPSGLEEGRAMRAVALDDHGTISDLALVVRLSGIAYLVSGEPSRRAATLAMLQASARPDFDVRVDDRTEATCALVITGPGSPELVAAHLSEALPPRLPAMHAASFEFHGFRTSAIRTSDTGEDGFEFMLAPAVAHHVVETLRSQAALAGHQALDVARVEACVPAFVPDLEPGLTPAEADLDALLGIDGGTAERILAAVLVDGDEPLPPGTPVVMAGQPGSPVGELRSCLRSEALDATIGLAVLKVQQAFPGTALQTAGGRQVAVSGKPFYRRRGTR